MFSYEIDARRGPPEGSSRLLALTKTRRRLVDKRCVTTLYAPTPGLFNGARNRKKGALQLMPWLEEREKERAQSRQLSSKYPPGKHVRLIFPQTATSIADKSALCTPPLPPCLPPARRSPILFSPRGPERRAARAKRVYVPPETCAHRRWCPRRAEVAGWPPSAPGLRPPSAPDRQLPLLSVGCRGEGILMRAGSSGGRAG